MFEYSTLCQLHQWIYDRTLTLLDLDTHWDERTLTNWLKWFFLTITIKVFNHEWKCIYFVLDNTDNLFRIENKIIFKLGDSGQLQFVHSYQYKECWTFYSHNEHKLHILNIAHALRTQQILFTLLLVIGFITMTLFNEYQQTYFLFV